VISVQPFGKWYARSLGSTASPWKTTSARKLVDHLDQAILTKAFRGELVPQDPNDEPVNLLLEGSGRNGKFGYQRGARRSRRNERSSCETPLSPLALERLIWLLKAVEIRRPVMFIAMNRFRVAKGSEAAFEHVWMSRDSHLEKVPGFVEFHLLKGPEAEDQTLYASLTVWENRAVFEAWTKSEAFRAAHSRAGDNKPLYLDHPQFEGFEVRQTVKRG
jgi:heme-degrading monooxygenase HmoA